MTTHRPSDDLLADYASGATPPGLSLLIAAHLTYAPESRTRVAAFERLAGALMAESEAADPGGMSLDAVFARIDAGEPEPAPSAPLDAGPLTSPVIRAIGQPFDAIPWRFRLPGVSEYALDGYGDERVSLLRARPGASVPQHTHQGLEATLVLQGALSDQGIVYRQGDVALNDEEDDHRPEIVGDELCYCLIVQTGGLTFTGRFSRVLNYFSN